LPSRGPLSQVLLYPSIHSFCLSICSWMERSQDVLLNAQIVAEGLAKSGCKVRIMIQYNPFW
jgi:hypothetical protein